MDADLSDRLTAGAAFPAGYGDLTAGAADSADGRLDSYSASLFGRYQNPVSYTHLDVSKRQVRLCSG